MLGRDVVEPELPDGLVLFGIQGSVELLLSIFVEWRTNKLLHGIAH